MVVFKSYHDERVYANPLVSLKLTEKYEVFHQTSCEICGILFRNPKLFMKNKRMEPEYDFK